MNDEDQPSVETATATPITVAAETRSNPRVGRSMPPTETPRGSREQVAAGARIDRFVVLNPAGAGGMGEVYAAYDPELDRKVALKRLRAENSGPKATSRLRREAQALARLTHPNVVAVHDVGTHAGQVFVAMEYVEGETLKAWLKRHPLERRDRATVLEMLAQAGAGLLAAHEQGLMHRDFKPSNVLVGRDGRVRVLDFGLARPVTPRRSSDDRTEPGYAQDQPSGTPMDVELTATGAILGTPAYMAPEQFRGRALDHRTDQFSFCLVAWEVLFGRRPFKGSEAEAYLSAIKRGVPAKAPSHGPVPAELEQALIRGLAYRPSARHRSLQPVLDALGRVSKPAASRTTRRIIGTIALLTVAGTAAAAYRIGAGQVADICAGAEAAFDAAWGDDRRQRVEKALSSSPLDFADSTWQRLEPTLDEYRDQWTASHRDACEATSVRKDQSSAMLSMRMACLDRSARAVTSFLDVLETAEPDAIENALTSAYRLPAIDHCDDLRQLSTEVEPPSDPEVAARVGQLRDQLASIGAQVDAGRYDHALEQLQRMRGDVESAGYRPLRAELFALLGRAHGHLDERRQAIEADVEAYVDTRASGRTLDALRIATALVRHAHNRDELESLAAWEAVARADAERIDTPVARYYAAASEVLLADARGQVELAASLSEQAVAEAERGTSYPNLIEALGQHSHMQLLASEYDTAAKSMSEAIALAIDHWGPTHPRLARLHRLQCDSLTNVGRHAEAQAECEKAVSAFELNHHPQSKALPTALHSLAFAVRYQGKVDEAVALQKRALSLLLAGDDDAPMIAMVQLALAQTYRRRNELEPALELLDEAQDRLSRAGDARRDNLGSAFYTRGLVLRDLQRLDEADDYFRQALEIWRETLGPEHINVGRATLGIASVLDSTGDPLEAAKLVEDLLPLYKRKFPQELHVLENHLGISYAQAGQVERALVHHLRNRELVAAIYEPDNPRVEDADFNIGSTLLDLGRPEEAKPYLDRSYQLRTERLEREHPRLLSSVEAQCYLYDALGHHEQLVPTCKWMLELLYEAPYTPMQKAGAKFTVAKFLWKAPGARAQALAMARECREEAIAAGDVPPEELLTWLRSHRVP
ncbi:MAG: tetratricopeptide repeat protein [Myxococcota bacterium]